MEPKPPPPETERATTDFLGALFWLALVAYAIIVFFFSGAFE